MNGLPFRDMDRIIDPVTAIFWRYKKTGFVEGIKVGIYLITELTDK